MCPVENDAFRKARVGFFVTESNIVTRKNECASSPLHSNQKYNGISQNKSSSSIEWSCTFLKCLYISNKYEVFGVRLF